MLSLLFAGTVGAAIAAGFVKGYAYYKRAAVVIDAVAVVEPKIVAAVATMAAARHDVPLAKRIEQAMAAAVIHTLSNGVSIEDTETIKAAMHAARERVLQTGE
jgi:type IV secretory pathway TrbL component